MVSTADQLRKEVAIGAEKKSPSQRSIHRDFRVYFVTTMLAMMADNIEHVISYWLLYEKFHSQVLSLTRGRSGRYHYQ